MPPIDSLQRTELSDLLRELEQQSAGTLRLTGHVKSSLYGAVPEPPANKAMLHDSNSAVGILKAALENIGRANDELVFLRDSCDLNLKGQQVGQAANATSPSARY